jgi:hypothetical protein
MSGPTTVVFTLEPLSLLLAAAAIRAAAAVQQGYAQGAALHQKHRTDREARQNVQTEAERQGQTALQQEADKAEAGFDRLMTLAAQLGAADRVQATRPLRPNAEDPLALAAYVRSLLALAAELKSILLTEAARQADEHDDQVPELAVPASTVPQRVAQRLLARIAHLGELPEELASLAGEIERTLPGEREDLLVTELRRRIQAHIAAIQKQALQQATATVVEQSLKDLGYQVEEVSSTLFVEGGVVHFRRQGWGEYMVRMRVDARAASVNFNVVRAVEAGNNERSVLDHLAEDRWCAEFPALLKALDVRGVRMNVTRRLEAGELPVQLVNSELLPKFSEKETATPAARQLQREIK